VCTRTNLDRDHLDLAHRQLSKNDMLRLYKTSMRVTGSLKKQP